MDRKWWHQSVVYQIYPRSFMDANGDGIGDLDGIIGKLDYLATLGIDVIWLSPVFRSPMKDNGYDISDYQDIAAEFGDLATMDTLIAEARRRGIRIIMDLVVNHTSSEHPWFVQARASRDNPFRDFYVWRDAPTDMSSIFGGSAWTLDEASGQYYLHLFTDAQPDLNWANPRLRQAIYRMMNWWLDRGIAGFRMDVIDLIGKEIERGITTNGAQLHTYLQEMNRATFGARDALTVGETWGADPEIAKQYSDPARNELNMVFQFEHITLGWDAEHGKWKPRPLDFIGLKRVLNKWQLELHGNGWNSLFWNNHDLPRAVSYFGDAGRYRVRSAKMLATVLHMMQGTPYVYQGEEIGMTNVRFANLDAYDDVELLNAYREKVLETHALSHDEMMEAIYRNGRDNARTPMQWDASEHAGFTRGTPWLAVNPNGREINAAQAVADADSIFHYYRRLIDLRRHSRWSPLIIHGRYTPLLADHPAVFAYLREAEGERLLVVCNFFAPEIVVALPGQVREIVLSSLPDPGTDLARLALGAYEAVVYRLR